MSTILPTWAQDVATISSVLGLGVTVWLLWEARKLKTACLRRARLPQLHEALKEAVEKLPTPLAHWQTDRRDALYQFRQVSAHLDDILPKLDRRLRGKAHGLQKQLCGGGFLRVSSLRCRGSRLNECSADDVWQLYSELSAFVTSLNNLLEDSSWQQ
jgi:hypothetical protein